MLTVSPPPICIRALWAPAVPVGASIRTKAARPATSSPIKRARRASSAKTGPHSRPTRRRSSVSLAASALAWAWAAWATLSETVASAAAKTFVRAASACEAAAAVAAVTKSLSRVTKGKGSITRAKPVAATCRRAAARGAVETPSRFWVAASTWTTAA